MDVKKMLAVATAVVGTVAMADIVSSSVVGYNKAATDAGENIYRVATFEAVGESASSFKIGDISVGEEDFAWWNFDYIATVNPYGSQDQYYTWDPDTSSWYECDDACTIDYEAPANDVELALNEAVIIFSANGANLTFSGAVMSGDTELYGIAGDNTYTGNFTPTTITLGDIVVGEEDFAWWNFDYIATINLFGSQDQYYTWDPDTLSWYECDDACTIDYESPANDVEFEPNMGFLYFTANGASLNIPSPL
jgi:hypothetical protein